MKKAGQKRIEKTEKTKSLKNKNKRTKKTRPLLYGPLHPWRVCPIGQHWVRDYERTNKKNDGFVAVHGYCRHNRTERDQLYPDELYSIENTFFSSLKGAPTADALGYPNGNDFDDLIRGWTKYWNDIFQSKDPLDPNLVKALIASESGFNPKADNHLKGSKQARGLMQVTEGTRKILQDEEGELDEHYITATTAETCDPNINISMGVRWLFHKRELLSKRLKRGASWEEAVSGFKATRGKGKRGKTLISRFEKLYERLRKEAQ